ncbi:MAG: hypothetical protein EOO43_15350, partial [Flavobacterium sp.]
TESDGSRNVPVVRQHYNIKNKGIDRANQLCATYRFNHAERKWWKTIMEHVIQVTLSNMYIIHQFLSDKPMSRIDFHLEIIDYLAYEDRIERPLKLQHYLDYVPQKRQSTIQNDENEEMKNSEVSKKDFRLNCKLHGCHKKSDLHCVGCTRPHFICSLCVPDCFIKYHQVSGL